MSENVQVAVRVRPFNEREKAMESTCCIRMVKETQQTIITDPETNVDKAFTFDYSYNSFVTQDDPEFASQDIVWNDIGVRVLEHAWNGFNVSLFAYGQTGAGKSFSMVGYGADKGIIPRASEVIFQRIESSTSEVVFKVEASMMEIYNERVKDLFNPSSDNLKIRDHPRQGPYAEGLTRHAVSSYEEISHLMDAGILARTTASTNMNATSSRAHTIFQIVVTQSELNPTTNKVMDKVSRINLIDLAGSERAASTGATGTRLKEGAAINQSLSALGNCISALADIANGKKKVLVPYRNSKLTHLLKDSLGGNSKTIMIAALSPASVNYSETLSTLRYADRAKQIKNQAIVNEDPNQLLIRQLKEELEALKKAMMENSDTGRPLSRGGLSDGSDVEASRREIDPEKEREITTIREQLEEHQRLLKESEKSWQERLKETEELARKREEQLKSLGLATNAADFKSKSLTEPHLLNLNEDQLMSEKLLYFIQLGPNKVGRVDAAEEQNIVIGGLGVLAEHCIITRTTQSHSVMHSGEDGLEVPAHIELDTITIRGLNNAKMSVNGNYVKAEEEVALSHCDRVILGNANVFRVVIPSVRQLQLKPGDTPNESQFDWQLAMKELNSNQIRASLDLEAQAEKEKREMDERVKRMEEQMLEEQKAAEEKLKKQKEDWEDHVRQLTEAMKLKELEIQNQMLTEGEQDKRRLAEQLAQQESKLAEELVKAEMSFEKKQEELVRKQQELEESLQKQMREARLLSQQKERERLERTKFDDQLLFSIPLIDEANTIADELQNQTTFAIKLITTGPSPPALSHPQVSLEDDEVAISGDISAELKVQVSFQEVGTFRSVMWSIDQFHTSIYAMREIYQIFIENSRVIDPSKWKHVEPDPFYDPPQPQFIGRAFIYTRNLYFGCRIIESAPIYDHRAQHCGHMNCEISSTVLSHEWQAHQHRLVETCPDDLQKLQLPTLDDFINSNIRIRVAVDSLRGIPGKLCKDVFVKLKWPRDDATYESPPAQAASIDPKLEFTVAIETLITADLVSYIRTHPIEIEVFGIVPSSNLNKVASRTLNHVEDDDEPTSVLFFDVDGERRQLGRRKSVRKRKAEDPEIALAVAREQLMVHEKALIENAQELETRTNEVEALVSQLSIADKELGQLREALEEMARTNKMLQVKLEQQIFKQHVSKTISERRKPIASDGGIDGKLDSPSSAGQGADSHKQSEINAQIKAAIFEESELPSSDQPPHTDSGQVLHSAEMLSKKQGLPSVSIGVDSHSPPVANVLPGVKSHVEAAQQVKNIVPELETHVEDTNNSVTTKTPPGTQKTAKSGCEVM